MKKQRRFGLLTALAGGAIALGSLTFGGSASAAETPNWTDFDHDNITVCPSGTQFDGQITSGSCSEALFDWRVDDNTYVTISNIDPSVTSMTAYIKGGDAYRLYDPVQDGQAMQAPLNNGEQWPTLSHWMLCYSVTPPTTTTELVTTTTELVTTTTGESGGPTTTTILATTTTVDDESGGPTTTTLVGADEGLPGTGGSPLLLALGLVMATGGLLVTALARPQRGS